MQNAIILAGMQLINNWSDGGNKALLRINGKMMVEYVVDAVRSSDGVGKVVVIGPEIELNEILRDKVDAVIGERGSIMENILAGARYVGFNDNIIICTSDIPLITSEAINDFIAKSKVLQADLCYPIVDKRVNDEKFPEIERTYVKAKEGSFTGGNIFHVNPNIIEKGLVLAGKLIESRKNALEMARLFGVNFMLQMSMGVVSISRAEKKISRIMKIKVRAVISEYPEIGIDVDKLSDLIVATAHLSR